MGGNRLRKVFLIVVLLIVFTAVTLTPPLTPPAFAAATSAPPSQQPAPSQSTTISGTDSLGVPEDPLGRQSEQQTPEISVAVDVRDGHLIARVVDVWGPGRVPLVVRSWTGVGNSPSGAGYWQFDHHLDVVGGSDTDGRATRNVLESNGNRGKYRFLQQNGTGSTRTNVYVKDVGNYSTLEAAVSCYQDYDDKGRPIWVCSETGNHTVYLPKGVTQRFSSNLITQEQDANGNVASYSWTSLPEQDRAYIASVTDPVSRFTTYGYESYSRVCLWYRDEKGTCGRWATYYRVKTATDPYGRVATYTYASGRIASVTNAAGFSTQYGYDGAGRLSSVTDAPGFPTTITWSGSPARVSQVTASDGTATSYSYTGNPVTSTVVTDARGQRTTYAISTAGNVTSATDPLGNATQYAYDSLHNVTQVTDARGVVTTFSYNSRNKVTQVVGASGTLNLTTSLSWDGVDNLLSATNPRGIRTDYTYDTKNNLTSVRRAVGTANEALAQFTYTTWGGVTSAVDPRGNTTTFAYTPRRQIQTVTPPVGGVTTYGYDTLDNQVSMTDGNGHTWTTAYNASRLPTTITDPLGNRVSYAYDANGNKTSATDPKNQTATFAYDSRDRLTTITDPLSGTTSYQYDAVGNLTRVTNARNSPMTFAYDAANRLTQVTDALGQATTYGYDAVGNRTSMRDRKGVTGTYSYDQVNRLTQVSAGGVTISYTYDANGNRLTLTDPTGTTTYTYDALDRLTRTAYPDSRSVQVAYDKASNRTSLVYPGGTVSLAYAYDPANRLTQVTQGTLQWTFAYDSAGNRTRLTQPNGTTTTYAYLTNNWLASIAHAGPGGPFQTISYTYDANGNRVTQTDSSGTTTFGYDALNRLTQAAYPGTYGTWSWAYDAVGNRTSQTAPSGQTLYTYDQTNRLTQAGAVVYSYDANGNLTGTSAGQSFTYDPFNRMTQAVGAGGTATYTYNGDGLKVQRIGPDGATRYYYDGIRPIWETDGAGSMTAQLDRDIFGNLLSRREASGTRRYYYPDGLGSTIALTDETGSVVASMLYDAWGQVRASNGTSQGKYRYTGAELDEATGLYHLGARFYDPTIGRWLGEDPARLGNFSPLSLNLYAFAWNMPTGLVDYTGLSPIEAILGTYVHHRAVAPYFVETFAAFAPSAHVGLHNRGLILDMMMRTPQGLEVYELKPASYLGDPTKLRASQAQLNNYIQALRAGGEPAVAGTTWQPNGVNIGTFNWGARGYFDVVLHSSPDAPGIIGYELVAKGNAAQALAERFGWSIDFAKEVLAILGEAWGALPGPAPVPVPAVP